MSSPISRRTFTATCAATVVLGRESLAAESPEVAPCPTACRSRRRSLATTPSPASTRLEEPADQSAPGPGLRDLRPLGPGDGEELLEKEPNLINAMMDWGAGDWESGLGAASHMGRRDIVEYLLEKGARIDIFCAAMMGQLDAVRAFLTLQPKLIDARGPHGFTLHFHAQLAEDGGKTLDYLQSVKKIELKPNPFLKKPADKKGPPPKPEK